MEANEFLNSLGDPGLYAWVVFGLLCFNYFPVAFNHLAMAIYGAKPSHHCNVPDGYQESNSTLPMTSGGKFQSCDIYVNYTYESGQTMECDHGWTFDIPSDESTVVSEWDLVCSRKYLTNLATSVYFTGVMLGGVIFGTASDKLGRKPVMTLTLFCPLIFGVMLHFVDNFILFVINRFFIGVMMQGLQTSSYVIAMELFVNSKYRAYTAALFETSWALGVMALAGIAYLLKDWRYIQLAITLPSILSLLYIWAIPESLRWLISNENYDEVDVYMARAAKVNKVTLPEKIKDAKAMAELQGVKSKKKYYVWDMFRTPKLRLRSIVMFYIWLATALGYYGLSLQASTLAGNKYLNFFISGAVELPAYLSGVWILSRFGRRIPLALYFLIGGTACILAGVIPSETSDGTDITWVSTALAWIGKFSTAGCWSVVFLYASELYPTVIRNVGVGACAFWARVGSVTAPQINTLGDYTKDWIPVVIFGSAAIIGGLLTFLLPETLDKKLPDTIEEAEDLVLQTSSKDTGITEENGPDTMTQL